MELTFLDILIVGAILAITFKGYKNGLMDNLIGFGGLLLVLFLSVQNMNRLSAVFYTYFQSHRILLTFFSFTVLAGGGWFFVNKIVSKLQVQMNPPPKWVQTDKIFGLILGFFQGIVFVSLFGMIFLVLPSSGKLQELGDRSAFLKPTLRIAPHVFNAFSIIFPDARSFADHLREGFGDEADTRDGRELLDTIEGDLSDEPYYNPYDDYRGPNRRK